MTPNPHYMSHQRELGWHMRRVLIDWIIQVHARFHLLPETLFLTVNITDRFLTLRNVPVDKLQLVGATAIFIASKYEEITCPSVEEIVFMVDNGYTRDEILDAERFMVNMLQFELGWPGPMSFLRRISKADDYDVNTRTLAKYLLEVTIVDERFVASPPSFVAAVAHALARRMLYKAHWVLPRSPTQAKVANCSLRHTCFIRGIHGDNYTQLFWYCWIASLINENITPLYSPNMLKRNFDEQVSLSRATCPKDTILKLQRRIYLLSTMRKILHSTIMTNHINE